MNIRLLDLPTIPELLAGMAATVQDAAAATPPTVAFVVLALVVGWAVRGFGTADPLTEDAS